MANTVARGVAGMYIEFLRLKFNMRDFGLGNDESEVDIDDYKLGDSGSWRIS